MSEVEPPQQTPRPKRQRADTAPDEAATAAPPPPAARADWLARFDALRRSLGGLGQRERSGEIDDFGLDHEYRRSLSPLFNFLQRRWWRIEVDGLPSLPAAGPLLFVANRSDLLPWDGLMIAELVTTARPGLQLRFLAPTELVTQPFAGPLLARLGGVRDDACNIKRLLESDRSVVAFPEATASAPRPNALRHQVGDFARHDAIRLAFEAGAPLVPVAVVGAGEANPLIARLRRAGRSIGLPALPIPPAFPLLGPLGLLPLPSKWRIHFGAPLEPGGRGAAAVDDVREVARLAAELQRRVQQLVTGASALRS